MVKLTTPAVNLGWHAADFSLTNVDGKEYSLQNLKGENGTIVMFICNHCPYVQEIIEEVVIDIKKLESSRIKTIAIMPNDTTASA